MPPCRRRSRTGKRGIITRRAKPKSSSTQRPPTRLRPPRTRTRRARRPTNTNAEFGMRNAESQWDVTRHDTHPDIPHSPFRIPHFGLTRRLHPDHHPPPLPPPPPPPPPPRFPPPCSPPPAGGGPPRSPTPGGRPSPRGRRGQPGGPPTKKRGGPPRGPPPPPPTSAMSLRVVPRRFD